MLEESWIVGNLCSTEQEPDQNPNKLFKTIISSCQLPFSLLACTNISQAFTTFLLPIINRCFPPIVCISNVSNSPWVLKSSQQRLKNVFEHFSDLSAISWRFQWSHERPNYIGWERWQKVIFTVCSIPSSCQLQKHTYCNDNDWHHPTEYAVTDVCPPLSSYHQRVSVVQSFMK